MWDEPVQERRNSHEGGAARHMLTEREGRKEGRGEGEEGGTPRHAYPGQADSPHGQPWPSRYLPRRSKQISTPAKQIAVDASRRGREAMIEGTGQPVFPVHLDTPRTRIHRGMPMRQGSHGSRPASSHPHLQLHYIILYYIMLYYIISLNIMQESRATW